MPYSLEIIADTGPLPRPEILLEWLCTCAPTPVECDAPLSIAEAGDGFELRIPFRCGEREARSLATSALRAARELRLAVYDPQLGRRVAEADLEVVFERWQELRIVVPDLPVVPPEAPRPSLSIIPLHSLAVVLFLALLAATIFVILTTISWAIR